MDIKNAHEIKNGYMPMAERKKAKTGWDGRIKHKNQGDAKNNLQKANSKEKMIIYIDGKKKI